MSRKIHALGTKAIGGQKKTACNSYMAEGHYAVTTSNEPDKVTCIKCQKARWWPLGGCPEPTECGKRGPCPYCSAAQLGRGQ